jgi:hypothetical protein
MADRAVCNRHRGADQCDGRRRHGLILEWNARMGESPCPEAAGFLAASIFPALVLTVLWPLSGRYDLESMSKTFIVYFSGALAAVVLLGIPSFLILRPLAPGKWWMPLVAGSILSIPLIFVLPGHATLESLVFVPVTAFSALVFWLVWRWLYEREGTYWGC